MCDFLLKTRGKSVKYTFIGTSCTDELPITMFQPTMRHDNISYGNDDDNNSNNNNNNK